MHQGYLLFAFIFRIILWKIYAINLYPTWFCFSLFHVIIHYSKISSLVILTYFIIYCKMNIFHSYLINKYVIKYIDYRLGFGNFWNETNIGA